MDVEPGVRPGEHADRLLRIEELKAHEEPEHGAAERLRQPRGVMRRPRDERPVGPEAAVSHEQVEVRMPVGAGTMRLETRDDADREILLAGQRADGGRDGARGDAGDLAEKTAAIQAIGAQPLRDGEHDLPVRHGRQERHNPHLSLCH